MKSYIEPIYLNEKMVLNCAAYIFKGVALESETNEGSVKKNNGNLSLGFKFLNDLISPISASATQTKESTSNIKTARRYTMGGLHMTLIDELNSKGLINRDFDFSRKLTDSSFVEIEALLKPVDFYAIIEAVKISTPLICKVLQNFGHKFSPKFLSDKKTRDEITKYEETITKILSELESDYLKSGQLEMIMTHPDTGAQLGVLDIDVSDSDALSVKSKLTDGQFRIIGRVSKQVSENGSISLVQRTVLSSILDITEKLALVTDSIQGYRSSMNVAQSVAQQVCQLKIDGPAARIMAMSICI